MEKRFKNFLILAMFVSSSVLAFNSFALEETLEEDTGSNHTRVDDSKNRFFSAFGCKPADGFTCVIRDAPDLPDIGL